ncbi:hypothetical protein DICVIV_12961 [Dictyocaulus viviparus]|uniref:Peptidase S1 domain-containing protein n=1 Tax=Dictyocaulus viviparus TaxID=29172 RepID=A0A0D8XF54_DICVI|nr:hypothetical protein DICVIV_12961 [Dictyocaulus viviparus]
MAGSSCLDPDECLSTSTIYKPSEILVYPDYDPCQKTNDLALITVASPISRMDGSPVCMPKEKEMFVTKMTAVGFGVDPTKSLYQTKLRALLLDVYSYPQKALLKITSQGKSICAGDSGGPLVKVNSTNKYIVMGIIYATDTDCRTKHPRTGVCPIENAQPTK